MATSLCLAGCLQVEAVPVLDAGLNPTDDAGAADLGASDAGAADLGASEPDAGELDPSVHWPPLVHDFSRRMQQIHSCESTLLWSFAGTQDDLGNWRNDEEVWAWEVGGTPQVLATTLRPTHHRRLVGCHEGFAYWNEADSGFNWSLHRRSTSASGPAEFVIADGPWTLGDEGRLTRQLDDDAGIEMFDVDDSTVSVFSYDGLDAQPFRTHERATQDYLYVNGETGARIAFAPGAVWSTFLIDLDTEFAPVFGRVVLVEAGASISRIREVMTDGTTLTLARSCEPELLAGPIPTVTRRGGWLLWNFASGPGAGCSEVGRSAVDEHGNVRTQPLPALSQWAEEMAADIGPPWRAQVRVVQFGQQIAFVNMVRGTIRLADEPPFPCIDTTLPCPEGAECATTLCSDLTD